jgi:hypothetical protein
MAVTIDGTNGITTPDLESAGQVTSNGLTTSLYPLISGTAVASTSGTSIDFTGIPSWVKRITVMFSGVSTNGTSLIQIQLGAGSVATSGYLASATNNAAASIATVASTAGFAINSAAAANSFTGQLVFSLISGNGWVALGSFSNGGPNVFTTAGGITLGGTLDRVRITTVGGTDTFDAGSINILYE